MGQALDTSGSESSEIELDKETLATSLETLDVSDYEWDFYLYAVTKTIDGKAMEFAKIAMGDLEGLAEMARSNMAEKAIRDRPVSPFDPKDPKEVIGAFKNTDPGIKAQLAGCLMSIENAVEWDAGDLAISDAKWAGYALRGLKEDGSAALFLKRANPLQASTKARLYIAGEDQMSPFGEAVMKISPQADFLMLGGASYFLSEAAIKDFDLESRDRAACMQAIKGLEAEGFVSDFSTFANCALKPKNMKKFHDYDEKIKEHIQNLDIVDRMDYLSHFSIELDKTGALDSFREESCEAIIDLITSRSCIDVLGRLAFGKIAPKE